MRTLKKLAVFIGAVLLSGTGLWGQTDISKNKVIPGSNGKMIVFYSLENWKEAYLSRNNRFVFGKNESSGFIYEIATNQYRYFESSYVVEVNDWDNYVTSTYAMIDGDTYLDFTKWNTGTEAMDGNDFTVMAASADLNTLMVKAYMTDPGSPSVTFIIDTKTGDILDTLAFFDVNFEEDEGIVSTGLAMSDDGKIIAGRSSMPLAYSNFSPAIWDRNRQNITYVGTEIVYPGDIASDGELTAISADGSFAAGSNNGNAYIVRYNSTTGTFTTQDIPRWAGCDKAAAWGVSDNHVVVGAEQNGGETSRIPYIYFADNETKYNLNDYVHYLYGVDAEQEMSLFTPLSLSSDARIITGFSIVGGSFYLYVVMLDATQAFAPALDVQASQNLGTANVQVKWNAPLKGDYTVQGYNVYRGQTQMNTSLVAADKTTFLDMNVPEGVQTYSVEAVYAGGKAPKSDSVSLYVIDPDGCLPVQNIYANVVYNRTVQIDWDRPSADAPRSKRVIETDGDVYPAGFFQPEINSLSAAVKVGDYIYTTTLGGLFTIYDAATHKAVKTIENLPLTKAYDMTYHDGIFWVACNSDQIIELTLDATDPLDVSVGRHWSARIVNVTHIAYVENEDESFNDGEDYLALGGYGNVLYYPTTARGPESSLPGSGEGFSGLTIGGSEYHDGKLYITDQNGANGCDLVTFDMATKKEIHRQNLFDNAQIVGYAGGSVSYPLGLTKTTLDDGTVVLECLMQSSIGYNFVVDLEIESAPNILGYVVYRNDEPVSDTLRFRHFEEKLFEEGTYVYTVEYLDKKGCSINSSDVNASATVVIIASDSCNPPVHVRAYESNRIAVLSWDDEGASNGLVGFNVYRNGSLISEPRFVDKKFYDTTARTNEEYEYVVEAFYNTSCVASDTVEITLTGKGLTEPPAAVTVRGTLHDKEDSKFDAKISWELPFFEEPMPLGYCKYPKSAASIGDASEVYCAIGWDADDMKKFPEDLYLVGVEFMLGTIQVQNIRTLVYVDDVLVHEQPYTDRFSEWEWIRDYFTKAYPMKQTHEIGVGYAVAYNPEQVNTVFVYDMGPGKPQYSDLISGNGESFDYLGRLNVDANLCINALVVRQRDLQAAASAPDPQAYIAKKVMTMDAVLNLSGSATEAPTHARKSTSDGIKLKGFHVYRDKERVNETLLTGLEYTDANLSRDKDEYEYRVSAVYDSASATIEKFSDDQYVYTATLDNETEAKEAGVSVYPNPSTGAFNLQMAHAGAVEIYDMTGRVVLRREVAAGVNGLSLDHSGVYMVRVLTNGKTVSMKMVVR